MPQGISRKYLVGEVQLKGNDFFVWNVYIFQEYSKKVPGRLQKKINSRKYQIVKLGHFLGA